VPVSTAYQKAAEKLRRKILSGKFTPGARLPTERALCEILGISRITVRLALDLLEEEHLITRHRGSGTYVNEPSLARLPLSIDYAGDVQKHAPSVRRKVRRTHWRSHPPEWTDRYFIEAHDRYLIAERIDSNRGETLAWDQAVIPERFAKKLKQQDLASLDFVGIWRKCQKIAIAHLSQRATAVAADEDAAKLFDVPVGSPLLRVVEIYESPEEEVLGAFLSLYPSEYIELSSRLAWPADDRTHTPYHN